MSDKEVLEKAIRLAIDGGWDAFGSESQQIDVESVELIKGELQPDLSVDKPGIYICIHRYHGTYSVQEVIYNHEFAKSLWGEELKWFDDDMQIPTFQVHLMQMVIADDPIQYLKENLPNVE